MEFRAEQSRGGGGKEKPPTPLLFARQCLELINTRERNSVIDRRGKKRSCCCCCCCCWYSTKSVQVCLLHGDYRLPSSLSSIISSLKHPKPIKTIVSAVEEGEEEEEENERSDLPQVEHTQRERPCTSDVTRRCKKVCSLHVIVSGVLAQWSNKRIDDHACKVAHTPRPRQRQRLRRQTASRVSESRHFYLLALIFLNWKRKGKERKNVSEEEEKDYTVQLHKKVSHYFISLAG